MADSKFDKLFENAGAQPPEPPAAAPPEAAPEKMPRRIQNNMGGRGKTTIETALAARPLGRPPGKRSDPAWKQFSVLLKRDTQREAATILRARDEGLDLSGLVQSLLESWIKRQK